MALIRKALGNWKCGLRWRDAVRAAVLDRAIDELNKRAKV